MRENSPGAGLPFEEAVAMAPWDYDGPEHAHRAPLVMLVAPDGTIVDWDPQLGDLLAPDARGDERPTCCRWFGCRGGGDGPLADACLTQLALDAGRELGELELPPGRLIGAALAVRSVPLAAGGATLAFLVRPAAARRRTVRVLALGTTAIDGDPTSADWLGRRPGALLKYLVCRRYAAVSAREIAETVWGFTGFASSGTVRHCVHELRDRLEPDRGPRSRSQVIVARQGGYSLDAAAIAVDADDFAVHVRRGLAAEAADRPEVAAVHLRLAVAMYRGHFMTDEPESEWAAGERERLREHLEDALTALARLRAAAGDLEAAVCCLRRASELQPFDCDVHRALVTLLMRQGRRSRALRCYTAFASRLEAEFGRRPGFELADLAVDAPTAPPAQDEPQTLKP